MKKLIPVSCWQIWTPTPTDKIKRFLPTNLDVDAAIGSLGKKNPFKYLDNVESYLDKLQRSKDLINFLEGKSIRGRWTNFETKSIKSIVQNHLDQLLKPKWRSRAFFEVLKDYLLEQGIPLTPEQGDRLNHNLEHSRFVRFFTS